MFEWIIDEDGDIGLVLFGLVTLMKYKDYVVVVMGRKEEWRKAGKYMQVIG